MKKSYIFISLSALCGMALVGCNTKSDDSGAAGLDSAIAEETAFVSEIVEGDSVMPSNMPFQTEMMQETKGMNKLELEYPTQGNAELLQKVRQWLNVELGGSYHGDLADPKLFFRHYALQLGHDPDLNECGGYTKDSFIVEYKNDLVVTYEHSSYVNEGGSHGEVDDRGVTFLQSDGTRFTRSCIVNYASIHSLIVEGLKGYFKVGSDEQLLQKLNNVSSVSDIQAPAIDPWITSAGVTFAYMPFEIADSGSMLTFSIPYAKIQPYLSEEGKKFF